MSRPFKEVENAFRVLRSRFRENAISRREYIDQLKKLRLRDDQGKFWMIGAQTGRWYYFDGRDWVLADPPTEQTKHLRCPACGLDNAEGAAACEHCGQSLGRGEAACPTCGAKLESPFQKCPACSQDLPVSPYAEEAMFKGKESGVGTTLIVKRLTPLSTLTLGGGTGLVLGIFAGAFVGVSSRFAGLAAGLPDLLSTLHGTLMGGIMFGVLGGVLGFLAAGVLGWLVALLFNLIASVTGGIRLTAERPEEPAEEKAAEPAGTPRT
jgi:hypothetical protein